MKGSFNQTQGLIPVGIVAAHQSKMENELFCFSYPAASGNGLVGAQDVSIDK